MAVKERVMDLANKISETRRGSKNEVTPDMPAYYCVGCGSCTTKCKFDAIRLVKKYDAVGVEYRKLKPTVGKYMLKRLFRLAGKSLRNSIRFRKR